MDITIKQAWTEMAPWHMGPGSPNGSTPGGMERHGVTIEVYEADFYGDGAKLYARGRPLFQTKHDRAPRAVFGGWDDGGLERIRARMDRVGAVL